MRAHERFRLVELAFAREFVEQGARDLPVLAGRGEIALGARQLREFEARLRLQRAIARAGGELEACAKLIAGLGVATLGDFGFRISEMG